MLRVMMKRHRDQGTGQGHSQLAGGRSGIGIQVVLGSGHSNTATGQRRHGDPGRWTQAQGRRVGPDSEAGVEPTFLTSKTELPAALLYWPRVGQKKTFSFVNLYYMRLYYIALRNPVTVSLIHIFRQSLAWEKSLNSQILLLKSPVLSPVSEENIWGHARIHIAKRR